MRKTALEVIILVVVLAISFLMVGYYWYNQSVNQTNGQNQISGQIDTSWVDNVNQMLKNVTPYPNGTDTSNPNVTLSYCRTYLYENSTSELVEFGNANDNSTNPISTCLNSLLLKANLQLNVSISNEFLNSVLANDKVVAIDYRISTLQFGGQQRFYSGYFILTDNLNDGMFGTIITVEVGKQGYSVWAIAK